MGDVVSIYLGDRLGYYRALADGTPFTSQELAQRTNTAERYAREWLEQQAVTGILEVDEPASDASSRRYRLPAGHAEALADPESLYYVAEFARAVVGMVSPLPAVLDAFRTGGGVPFDAYGEDLREGLAGANRAPFLYLLGSEWLPALPDIHVRLQADPPARIADIGCGSGWSSIGIARAYPKARVDGFDLDEASIEAARKNAESAGVADRVSFHARDAGDSSLTGTYDFACAFECIHDMSNPVAALNSMRRMVGDGGTVLIADERTAEEFSAPGDEYERLLYGFSILHCLPVGMVDQPSAETGTVMRPVTLKHYAEQAGFQKVEVLPIEYDFWNFYRLTA
jgi:2-polyprenyl-3-methyl-5-hydroxy-6-metoxy-1,4-benzoquinol methylase